MNALAHCAEALYAQGHNPAADEHALAGARLDLGVAAARRLRSARPRGADGAAPRRLSRRRRARRLDARARACDGAGDRRPLRAAARDAERDLPAARAPFQRRLRAGRGGALRRGGRRADRSRPAASRSSRRSPGRHGSASSACRRPTCPRLAADAAQRGGNLANPKPATPEEIERLLREVF